MPVKTTVTIAIRPDLKKQLDELTTKADQSRSETTCRLLGLLLSNLLLSEIDPVTFTRDRLFETLRI